MNLSLKKIAFVTAIGLSLPLSLSAQENEFFEDSFTTESTEDESDIIYKKRVVRALDLRELSNRPLMAKNHEISKYLISAVEEGLLTPYSSDSLKNELSITEFQKRISLESEPMQDTSYMDEDEKADYLASLASRGPQFYFASDLYQFEITEDILFDKERSQWRYDIQSISIFVPADHPDNIRGIQQHVATFDYKKCEPYFKEDPRAVWINPFNDAENRTLADAFNLRLFSSYIIKVSNPKDEYLVDIYGYGKQGRIASDIKAQELLEFEHNLWEF